jgi:hypothetical protein
MELMEERIEIAGLMRLTSKARPLRNDDINDS